MSKFMSCPHCGKDLPLDEFSALYAVVQAKKFRALNEARLARERAAAQGLRHCPSCSTDLPQSEFSKRNGWCKLCRSTRQRARWHGAPWTPELVHERRANR